MRGYASIAAAFCALTLAACGGSKVLTLGTRKPKIVAGPELVELPVPAGEEGNNISNATLTDDMLEIVFSSNWIIRTAKRASIHDRFDGAVVVLPASDSLTKRTSPAISPDGRTLWFASKPDDSHDYDVWVSQRSSRALDWPAAVRSDSLSTPGNDLPRPLGNHGLVLPLSVYHTDITGKAFEIFFANRGSISDDFAPPVAALDLPHPPGGSATDPFLTDDGLHLFYSDQSNGNPGDIVLAEHDAWGHPFDRGEPVEGVNTTDWKEGDPWLSADGKTLYFTSHRIVSLDGGAIGDGGTNSGNYAYLDRIYRVEFDVPWMP